MLKRGWQAACGWSREPNFELRTNIDFGLKGDLPLMGRNTLVHEKETKARSPAVRCVSRAEETVENMGLFRCRNSAASITHRNHDCVSLAPKFEAHRSVGRRILERVADEIRQYALNENRVEHADCRFRKGGRVDNLSSVRIRKIRAILFRPLPEQLARRSRDGSEVHRA